MPLDIEAVFKPRVPTVANDFVEEDKMETEVTEHTQAEAPAPQDRIYSGRPERDIHLRSFVTLRLRRLPCPSLPRRSR